MESIVDKQIRMGIDQSYNFAAVVVLQNSNVIDFEVIKSNKDDTIYNRALDVATRICDVYSKHKPEVVQMEGLAFGTTGNVTRDLAGLLFTIINVMKILHPTVNVVLIPPTAVKKFATGSGKSKKPEMIAALPPHVRELFEAKGYKKTTGLGDLSDAYWIGTIPA
jgi:Holliday junction resolvasome RuvABC endonuclease subunit